MRPEVTIHRLAQAKATLREAELMGVEIQLRSAPGAAAYAGVGYLKALGEAVGHELLVDCDDDAGLVMAALRTGCKKLTFAGVDDDERRRLSQMAGRCGATLRGSVRGHLDHRPPCLTLAPDEDDVVIRDWLEAQSGHR